jgi:hypothetical protein
MKYSLYEIGISLTLYRTVEVPEGVIDPEDYINEYYATNATMKEAIDDNDFEIEKLFSHRVGE